MISHLNVGDVELTTKSLIVLGNIASEGGDTRDEILERGVLQRLYYLY